MYMMRFVETDLAIHFDDITMIFHQIKNYKSGVSWWFVF